MKPFVYKHKTRRKGSLVILLVGMIGAASVGIVAEYANYSAKRIMAVEVTARKYQAWLLAYAGFQAALSAIRTVPEDALYSNGLVQNPPELRMKKCEPDCFITYRILPEDGKINVNHLVRGFDDSPNETYRMILERMFSRFDIPIDAVDSMIDWIDENGYTEGRGAEASYYESLTPPISIKDGKAYNLSEFALVKDLDSEMLYSSRAPDGWIQQQKELSFQTEDERNLITEEDWILSNNLTAYYTDPKDSDDRININAARYHTLMSLSDNMSRSAVLALFKLRRENDSYIEKVDLLQSLPEFQIPVGEDLTLYQELTGGGGVTGLIKTESRYFRIIGIGSIFPPGKKKNNPVVSRVEGLYDKKTKQMLYYSEE